ncbi:hypothetical protein F5B20DRAFT_531949 [Whalleya microplaca]|nr:hypothetical protein F5B20DRAFT_531949 [Whalleya microplaca]
MLHHIKPVVMQTETRTQTPVAHKVRSACDICHKAKMKCSRGHPCVACTRSGNLCRYSISQRLGRPPKGFTRGKINSTSNKNREQTMHSTTTTAQTSTGSHSQPNEDLFTLDEMFMDTFSDSSCVLSSPEVPSNHAFTNVEDVASSCSPIKDGQSPWLTFLDQPNQSPIEINPYNTPERSPQLVPSNHTSTSDDQEHGSRGEVARCHCFQQHSRFLCHLKDLDRMHNSRFISITLDAARQIIRLWRGHLSCQSCWYDADNGALLLLVMSVGTIIKRLWNYVAYQQQHDLSFESLPESGGGTSNFSGVDVAGAESDRTRHDEPLRQHDPTVCPIPSPIKIRVSEFQVPEEEQMFVIAMLVIRMLRRIKEGLEELRIRIEQERWGDKTDDSNRHPLNRAVPLMLDDLGESVRELEQSLKAFIMQ